MGSCVAKHRETDLVRNKVDEKNVKVWGFSYSFRGMRWSPFQCKCFLHYLRETRNIIAKMTCVTILRGRQVTGYQDYSCFYIKHILNPCMLSCLHLPVIISLSNGEYDTFPILGSAKILMNMCIWYIYIYICFFSELLTVSFLTLCGRAPVANGVSSINDVTWSIMT